MMKGKIIALSSENITPELSFLEGVIEMGELRLKFHILKTSYFSWRTKWILVVDINYIIGFLKFLCHQ